MRATGRSGFSVFWDINGSLRQMYAFTDRIGFVKNIIWTKEGHLLLRGCSPNMREARVGC